MSTAESETLLADTANKRKPLAVDAVLLLNAAAVVAEVELLAREDLGPLGALEYASAPLFDAILLLELALKVWCLGGRWLGGRRRRSVAQGGAQGGA